MTANHERQPVLIIALYSKRIGFAVFRSRDLVYFGLKTFKRPRTTGKMCREISQLVHVVIGRFHPVAILVNAAEAGLISGSRQAVVDTLREVSAPTLVHEESFAKVRRSLLSNRHATTADTFQLILSCYPELGRYAASGHRYQHSHGLPVLTAVTIGHFYTRSADDPAASRHSNN